MADLGNVPFAAQDVQEVQTLIQNLEGSTKKYTPKSTKKFSCKRTSFNVEESPANIVVNSWRFQDWDYKRDDLPTYARGLFTAKNEKGQPEIAVRGYDKFFNTEEVTATRWRNIESNTKGPYELSLKENGCIVFISGLHDGTLLVCSKHSTGSGNNPGLSHAKAAEKWVDKQLKAIGRSREDLARELRKRNATAVAELCDDDFEEHILAYRGDDAGLYLHGININLPEFMTYSGPQVQAFAAEWGFKKTDFLVIEDIYAVKTFLEKVAETGSYQGRDVEGFVVRCKCRTESSGPHSDWFFKYKFEEPYLMYRQWRECTKALIAGKPPRYKKHAKITEEYLMYVRKCLAANSQLGQQYQQNHGIIKLRNDFLDQIKMNGSDIIRQEYAELGGAPEDKHERRQLIDDVKLTHKHVRLVALNFVHDREALDKIRQVTHDRIVARGDNHQTIQAASDIKKVIGIMEGFIHRFEPMDTFAPPDDGFDSTIDLDPTQDSRQNLETVISHLSTTYPKLFTSMPTSDELDEAISFALTEYKPSLKHDLSRAPKNNNTGSKENPAKKKKRAIEYISIALPKNDIKDTLDEAFASVSSNKARFYRALEETRRVQQDFHVTLIHRASSKQHPEIWQKYSTMHEEADPWNNKIGECQVMLERIVWDDRIMAIVARIVDDGWECVNEVAHITVGTRGDDVKPKESNDLLKRWLAEGSGDSTRIGEVAIEGRKIVSGVVKSVLAR
ncbi:fungal tRNA ligase adenylyltransferase protein [Rutstroemia sp. NJR-2017a BBW]|nr:fungal tRNA ligase adenylyltransferase protein [Rutstroemia sp. NJR-2017a BBW]